MKTAGGMKPAEEWMRDSAGRPWKPGYSFTIADIRAIQRDAEASMKERAEIAAGAGECDDDVDPDDEDSECVCDWCIIRESVRNLQSEVPE